MSIVSIISCLYELSEFFPDSTKLVGPTLGNCAPRLFTVRNALLEVPLSNEPFANKGLKSVQPLTAQNLAQIQYKLEESLYPTISLSFPNATMPNLGY